MHWIFNLGRCSAYGDPHFITFDNKWFVFNGICKYVLARDYVTNLFDIIIENVACNQLNDVSCARSVTVLLNGTSIMLNQHGRVSVNDTSVNLPYMGPGILIRKVCNTFLTLNAMLHWKTGKQLRQAANILPFYKTQFLKELQNRNRQLLLCPSQK